jgi:tRNA pseudouridine32 synthase/23S rRNA pseudouridine746 synthase
MYELIDENADFLVIYKKPNTSFHSDSGEIGLFEYCKQQQGLSELYPVHRLDKVTSGLLLMAKTAEINNQLTAAFRARHIEKYYLPHGAAHLNYWRHKKTPLSHNFLVRALHLGAGYL